ncbi:MAG: hypothetical protein IJ564_03200 [Alphaproteobacteria bacterium]|nr:hypothetical protein [Alphaproteobacteria bacterium]MBR3662499.1 hypothetical protein [Alphaproteobacteria bacterium]
MNKIFVGFLVVAVSACTAGKVENQKLEDSVAAELQTNVSVPCSYSCVQGAPCQNVQPAPMVLKPRVTETVSKKRPCCLDEDKNSEEKTIIPNAPEIYVISANRTVRSMINDIEGVFKSDKKAKMYVAETVNNEADMPGGIEKGVSAIKRNLKNTDNIDVTDNRSEADYVVTSEVAWFDTPTKQIPAIKYSIGLYDTYGKKLGEWHEVVHQAAGDRSWW